MHSQPYCIPALSSSACFNISSFVAKRIPQVVDDRTQDITQQHHFFQSFMSYFIIRYDKWTLTAVTIPAALFKQ